MEQSYLAQTVNLSGELETVRKKLELAEQDNSKLRSENEELTTRIIEEKDKTASQMNAMNEIFDGTMHLHLTFIPYTTTKLLLILLSPLNLVHTHIHIQMLPLKINLSLSSSQH
jgi:hypothetical protein